MIFYFYTFVFFLKDLHYAFNYLISKIVDMGPSLYSTNRINKTDLLKLAITNRADYLPSITGWSFLNNLRKFLVLNSLKIEISILCKVFDVKHLSI